MIQLAVFLVGTQNKLRGFGHGGGVLGIVLQRALDPQDLVLKTRCAARTKTPADQLRMPSRFIREASVVGFRPRSCAAPFGPYILPPVFWSAEETLAASSARSCESVMISDGAL